MTAIDEPILRRGAFAREPSFIIAAPRPTPRYLSHLLLLAFTATAVLATNHVAAFLSTGGPFALAWPVGAVGAGSDERLQYFAARPILATLPGVVEAPAPPAVVEVESPPQRQEAITYAVQPGDTLSSVAIRFGLSWETISWANELPNVNSLRVAQELLLPPIDGYYYTVKAGDTLSGIAVRYKSDVAEIIEANGVAAPDAIFAGQRLLLPGGRPPPPPPPPPVRVAPLADGAPAAPSSAGFVRPLTGLLTQYFGYWHEGLDIARPHGTPVVAAASGRVVEARKLGYSYGWYLIVDHGNGFRTMYAHLSAFLVDLGDYVEQGQVIGRVGTTGRSTGPHVHFEVHLNGQPVNPLNYLP